MLTMQETQSCAEAETATKKWGGGGFKLWGGGPRLRIIRLHEDKLRLVSWGLGEPPLWESHGQTSGSVVQCSPSPGNEMILYFSVQLVEKLGGAEPPPPI